MSKIIPISYTEKYTTKEKRFIINDVICIGYSIIDDMTISILFALHQDLFDKYEYFNMNINLDNHQEEKKFKMSGMYIKDLQTDAQNALKIKDMCKYLKPNNLFTTDLNFEYDQGKGFYITKGIRSTGKDLSEVQEYQINKSVYIQLRIFKAFLQQCIITNNQFFDNALKTVTSIPATHSKLDGTIMEEIKSVKSGSKFYKYTSHYTFQCGPTSIKVNYAIDSHKQIEKSLREPMVYDQFMAQFKDDPKVTCTLYEDSTDEVLVIIVDSDKTKTTVVRLNKELYNQTNFKDITNYIFYSVDTTNNGTIPHIKFEGGSKK